MVAARKESFNYQYQKPNLTPWPSIETKPATRTLLSPILSTGLLVVFLVAIGTFIVHRSAVITEKNRELLTVRGEYSQILEEQKHLQLNIARLSALTRIEKIATEELGLKSPNPNQIIYINRANND